MTLLASTQVFHKKITEFLIFVKFDVFVDVRIILAYCRSPGTPLKNKRTYLFFSFHRNYSFFFIKFHHFGNNFFFEKKTIIIQFYFFSIVVYLVSSFINQTSHKALSVFEECAFEHILRAKVWLYHIENVFRQFFQLIFCLLSICCSVCNRTKKFNTDKS